MIENILQHLEKVQKKGHNAYVACCPAHDDRSPSLAIREVDGERVLIKCFAGCSVQDVLGAIGLKMEDLFPPRPVNETGGYKRLSKPFTDAQLLAVILKEAGIIDFAAHDIAAGRAVSATDAERIALARDRIHRAVHYAQS